MNLKCNHGGDTIIIPTTDEQPSGKRLAIRHDETIYYAPIVNVDDTNATAFKLTSDGGVYALGIGAVDTTPSETFLTDDSIACAFYGKVKSFNATGYPSLVTINSAWNSSGVKVTLSNDRAETFMHGSNSDTLKNFDTENDSINLQHNSMDDLQTFTVGAENGITLNFGGNNKIVLPDVDIDATINIAGTSYVFTTLGIVNASASSVSLQSSISTFSTAGFDDFTTFDFTHSDNISVTLSGDKAETLIHGTGDDTFYNLGSDDVIQTRYGIYDLRGITLGSETGISLVFGEGDDTDRITLPDLATDSAVNIGDRAWQFTNERAKSMANLAYRYVFVGGNVNLKQTDLLKQIDLGSIALIIANNGGTVEGGQHGMFIGGKNASAKGGGGADTFLYNGGSMTIASYTTSDQIKLADGYSISGSATIENGNSTFPLSNGKRSGTLIIESVDASQKSIGFTSYGSLCSDTINNALTSVAPSAARIVTLLGNKGDFGIIADSDNPNGYDPTLTNGTEYYANLYSITATRENSTIVGSSKASHITIVGGKDNVLTGGIGTDRYYFKSGGGIITDFGIGAGYGTGNVAFPAATTDEGYNRFDPTSYARGADSLSVGGTILEIAYAPNYSTGTLDSLLTVYVTYDNDGDLIADYTIMLPDIVKRPTNATANPPKFLTDLNGVKSIKAADSRQGTTKLLATTLVTALAVTKDNSAYPDNIAYLDALYTNIKGGSS